MNTYDSDQNTVTTTTIETVEQNNVEQADPWHLWAIGQISESEAWEMAESAIIE